MHPFVLGILLLTVILFFGILPFMIPTYLEYYRIYKQIQEPFGLSDFQCVWESVKDTLSDIFSIEQNNEETDR
jgi:hypothetical protein